MAPVKTPIRLQDPFCAFSHGAGALLSVAALVVLLIAAHGRPLHMTGFAIYGASLIILYTISTLYHSFPSSSRFAEWLQRFDYCGIFLLIAGTYTPVCLVGLRGGLGWSMLTASWILALIGIVSSLAPKRAPDWLRVTLCIVMGWMAILAIGPLRVALSSAGLGWLVAGGVVYSIGTVIYATDRPHLWPNRFSAHDLWHLFVLGGSACHFVVMLFLV